MRQRRQGKAKVEPKNCGKKEKGKRKQAKRRQTGHQANNEEKRRVKNWGETLKQTGAVSAILLPGGWQF